VRFDPLTPQKSFTAGCAGWLTEGNEGYVQGMSDLCAPIYVVMGGEPEMTFWCFVEVMDRMVSSLLDRDGRRVLNSFVVLQKQNFLRDQSGMKKQLSTLQQLIAVMDPELYRHFGESVHLARVKADP
jgi:hypothetical protein